MKRNAIVPYLANCFWLLLPILAFNAIFAKYLPPQYQSESFWNNIPAWIAIPENLLPQLTYMAGVHSTILNSCHE